MPRKTKEQVVEEVVKKKETKETNARLEPVKRSLFTATLKGVGDLILCKKSRSYELDSTWANENKNIKGVVKPKELCQPYNAWEKLITSIHWLKPITIHDDWSKYTKEEWDYYMANNMPCVCMEAIRGSIHEAFITFHYKERTDGLNWSDFERSLSFTANKYPITFATAKPEQDLVNLKRSGCVLSAHNVFSGWACEIGINFVEDVIPHDTIIDILSTAGSFVGIHTQRTNGYGRFVLDNISVTTLESSED